MKIFRRILVPHDFSEAATTALRVAAGLAKRHGGRLTVLHVVTPYQPVTYLPEVAGWISDREIVAGAKRSLDELVRRELKGNGAPPARFDVDLGDPSTRIVDAARNADSIVMGTEGRTGLSHLLLGSVAEKVVRHSPIPVLTIRPAGSRKVRRRPSGRRGRRRVGA
jgi:nucleotide-binding universal stress UspA family protein